MNILGTISAENVVVPFFHLRRIDTRLVFFSVASASWECETKGSAISRRVFIDIASWFVKKGEQD